MSKIRASYGLNIDKTTVKFSNIRKHNYRDKQKFADKNIHINWKWTPCNTSKKFFNWRKKLEDYARPYVKKYNQRQKKQGHAKRAYKSVDDYLKKNAKNATRCGIVSLGDTNFRKKFEHDQIIKIINATDDVSKQEALTYLRAYVEPKALINYARDFNKRHKYIKWSDVVVHVDESFLHFHGRLVALPGYTKRKNGKRLSFSINKALQREYPNAVHSYHLKTIGRGKNKHRIRGNFKQHDGRLALHELNDEEAPNLIDSFKKSTVADSDIELIRKGHWVRHRDNYWQIKQSESADKLKKSTAKNNSATISASLQTSSIKSKVAKAYGVINRASSANAELKSIKSKVKLAYNVINRASSASTMVSSARHYASSRWTSLPSSVREYATSNQSMNLTDYLTMSPNDKADYKVSVANSFDTYNSSSASTSMSKASASISTARKSLSNQQSAIESENIKTFGIIRYGSNYEQNKNQAKGLYKGLFGNGRSGMDLLVYTVGSYIAYEGRTNKGWLSASKKINSLSTNYSKDMANTVSPSTNSGSDNGFDLQ